MRVAIDSTSEHAFIKQAMQQRSKRLDKPAKTIVREARELARTDLLSALMSAKPGELS